MQVNVVKVPEDSDFNVFAKLCDNHSDWDLVYSKRGMQSWTRATTGTSFKMIKGRYQFDDVSASTVYDVLHDAEYRRHWDKYMLEGTDIGFLNPNNDICYYALRSPPPFCNRDFVLQRSWLETPKEMIIFNHSVCHEDYPPRKGTVRATSFLTGYLVRPLSSNKCEVTYLTQSDPGGSLPPWVVNKLAEVVCPSVMKKLHKNCVKYPAWKAKHNASMKPWLFPEQLFMHSKRVELAKCTPREYAQQDTIPDESKVVFDDRALLDALPLPGGIDDENGGNASDASSSDGRRAASIGRR